MRKFTPWTDEEAEKAAYDILKQVLPKAMWETPMGNEWTTSNSTTLKVATLAIAWAAAQIEKCETVHGGENNMGTLSWSPSKMNDDTHIAKLVGVREVEK